MSFITRQQFMTELSKLLTFMYDEDRQRALKMYERMFDIAEDDQGLIQHLMSPTRQAVVVARAYDAKERKLSVSAQKKGDEVEEDGEVPPFVLAINKIFDELFPQEDAAQALTEDQVSFFDLGVDPVKEEVKKPVIPKAEVLLSDTQNFPAVLPPDDSEEAEDAAEEEAREPEESEETLEEELEILPEAEESGEDLPEKAETAAVEDEEHPDSEEEEPENVLFPDEKPKEPEAASEAAAEENAPADSGETEKEETDAPKKDLVQTVQDLFSENEAESGDRQEKQEPKQRQRSVPMKQETNVPLLVLFLIAAIPITLALLILLSLLAMASLGLAVTMIGLGVTLILAAISFGILADKLVMIGAAVIALALGLVFLWLTIWIIFSVMVALVNSVRDLARKWCCKEVPAI